MVWALRVQLLSVGKSGAGDAFLPLVQLYQSRLSCTVLELPPAAQQASDPEKRMGVEGERLLAKCGARADGYRRLVLDERGVNLSSTALAKLLLAWQDEGARGVDVLIGGDQGLSPAVRDSADQLWALGAATWPHKLVRVMVLEQLYRARQIILGHPYHHG
jgi:23S rRNA (pseudouridine1915-N3)-methyltransferase